MKILVLVLSLFIVFSGCEMAENLIGAKSGVDDSFNRDTRQSNSFSFSFPSNNRNYFIDDETSIRTVTFNYSNVDYIECSTDGGATYSDCTGNNYIWGASAYNTTHYVRIRYNDGQEETRTFTPSSEVSGKNFYSCNHTISGNESMTTFDGRTFAANDVVCFEDGVTISGTIGHTLDASNLTYIVRDGQTATITSSVAGNIISTSGMTDFVIVGLSLSSSTTSAKGIYVNSTGFIADDINVNMTGNNAYALEFASIDNLAVIRNSEITTTDTASSTAIRSNDTQLEIRNSTISGGYYAVFFWRPSAPTQTLTAYDSVFKMTKTDGSATAPGIIASNSNNASNSSNFTFNDCEFLSASGPSIFVFGSAGTSQFNFNNTQLKADNTYSVSGPAIHFAGSNAGDTVTFDTNSLVCKKSAASTNFSSIIDDTTNGNASTNETNMSAHSSNTDIGTCTD